MENNNETNKNSEFTNTSGMNERSVVPNEIKKWNWGAFSLTWIWGLANGVYISLLCLIPIVGFVFSFVLGANGNAYAWKNKCWKNIQSFNDTQSKWNIAGIIVFAIQLLFFICLMAQ